MMKLSVRMQLLLIVLITLAVYYPVIHSGIAPVDDLSLVDSLLNADILNLQKLFLPGSGYYYRPVAILSFHLDQFLWGLAPSFMHLENVLLHLLNSLLLYGAVVSLCRVSRLNSGIWPLIAALLFALHPVNTESVCWISGRTDLIAGSFIIGALWCILASFNQRSNALMATAIGLFFLACLTKETAIFFVGGAVLIVLALKRQEAVNLLSAFKSTLVPAVIWLCSAFAYLGWRAFALAHGDSGIQTALRAGGLIDGQAAYLDKIRIALKVTGFYLKKIFLPLPLNFGIIDVHDGYVLLGCLLVVIFIYLLWRFNLASALFLTSFCLGLQVLLVVFGQMTWTPIAERYLYLSTITFVPGCILLLGQKESLANSQWLQILVVSVLCVSGFAVQQRSLLWSDPVLLMEDTVEKSPDFVPAWNNLATLYSRKGETEKAQVILDKMSKKLGDRQYSAVDINRADLLVKEENFAEARTVLRERLNNAGKNYSKVADSLVKVNLMWLGKKPSEEMMFVLRRENVELLEELSARSSDPFLRYRLAKAYLTNQQLDEARESFRQVYETVPDGTFYKAPAGKLYRFLAESTSSAN